MTLKKPTMSQYIDRFRFDPVAWVQTELGVTPQPWQAQVLEQAAHPDTTPKIAVRSGHGVGKSALDAWIALHALVMYSDDVKVLLTAPTRGQIKDVLWPELAKWHSAMQPVINQQIVITKTLACIKSNAEGAFVVPRTAAADKVEAMQGVRGKRTVVLIDEASGVPMAVYEAIEGSMSSAGATTVLTGNPTRNDGYFYKVHTDPRSEWATHHVSCVDNPRVSQAYIDGIATSYGLESNNYSVRVLGQFPDKSSDSMFSQMDINNCTDRAELIDTWPLDNSRVWGLDVARFGDDKTVLCVRSGHCVISFREWAGLDTMQVASVINTLYQETEQQPVAVYVDAIGIGAGVADRLLEQGVPVHAVNVGSKASYGSGMRNLRAEIYHRLKEWTQDATSILPQDDHLLGELMSTKYKITETNTIQIVGKDIIKKDLGRSPDLADALALTFSDGGPLPHQQQRYVPTKNPYDLSQRAI